MSAKASQTDEAQTETVEICYGDTFRHRVTGEKKVVEDVRENSEKVVWASGGWDYKDELQRAVNEESGIYEVIQRHDEWEETPY